MRPSPLPTVAMLTLLVLAGCATGPAGPTPWSHAPVRPTAIPSDLALVEVYKSPTCDCCHQWEGYMREHGYTVRSVPVDDMTAVKVEHGIPQEAWSCHTALIAGYVVEGHVPVEAVEDLLARRPDIDGIALPGMPPGSPGMPGVKEAPFQVLAIRDGTLSPFGDY